MAFAQARRQELATRVDVDLVHGILARYDRTSSTTLTTMHQDRWRPVEGAVSETADSSASDAASDEATSPRRRRRRRLRWRLWLRAFHRDIGYLIIGLTFVYAISGLAVNHIEDWNPNFDVSREELVLDEVPQSTDAAVDVVLAALEIKSTPESVYRSSPDQIDVQTAYWTSVASRARSCGRPTGCTSIAASRPGRWWRTRTRSCCSFWRRRDCSWSGGREACSVGAGFSSPLASPFRCSTSR